MAQSFIVSLLFLFVHCIRVYSLFSGNYESGHYVIRYSAENNLTGKIPCVIQIELENTSGCDEFKPVESDLRVSTSVSNCKHVKLMKTGIFQNANITSNKVTGGVNIDILNDKFKQCELHKLKCTVTWSDDYMHTTLQVYRNKLCVVYGVPTTKETRSTRATVKPTRQSTTKLEKTSDRSTKLHLGTTTKLSNAIKQTAAASHMPVLSGISLLLMILMTRVVS